MEQDNEIIECKIQYVLKAALAQFLLMMIGTFSTILIARAFNLPIVGFVGFIVFFIVPAFYNQPIKDYFTKQAKLIFNPEYFLIEFYNLKTEALEATIKYRYDKIKSMTLNSKQNQYSTLIFSFIDNSTVRYSFIDDIEENNTSIDVYNQIELERKKASAMTQPILARSFYSSKTGTILIVLLGIGIFGLMIYQLFYSLKTLPFSFLVTIFLYIQIMARRKADVENFKKLNNN